MARMTRARVKQEQYDFLDQAQPLEAAAATSPIIQHTSSRAVTVSSTVSPVVEPQTLASSGNTTLPDDTDMGGVNGGHIESAYTNGGVQNNDVNTNTNVVHSSGMYANGGHTTNANTNGMHTNGFHGNGMRTDGHHNTPPVPDAMHTLGQHSRQLIQVIRNLDKLCISTTLPSLPKFVVVGDQSAGKSSIIEAVCDISLPRSEGTCTRCPFQITTMAAKTDDSLWTCRVSLHLSYMHDKRARAGNDPQKYDNWHKVDLETVDFLVTHDKTQLDGILKRAQLALLNPGQNPAMYARAFPIVDGTTQVGFSPNVVSLEIEAPGLPELSLFDLPGAINRHEDENEQYLVGFIEKLMKNYLRDEKALVLLACSANSDVETSTAFRFVGECQAVDRCMGVLTKPDLIQRPRFGAIRRILNEEVFRVGNSWFITKLLSQEELIAGTTHAEARQREREFFGYAPWATDLSDFTDRFGIANVQRAISQKLTAHISEELPVIVARVQERLGQVTTQLATFPSQPVSAAHTVMAEMQDVVTSIITHVRGDTKDREFRNAYKSLLLTMRAKLKQLEPEVELRTPGYTPPAFGLDDDDDDNSTAAPTPSKRSRGHDGLPILTPQRSRAAYDTPRSHRKSEAAPSAPAPAKTIFKLDEVRDRFDRGSSSMLPDQVDLKVRDELILRTLAGWESVAKTLVAGMQRLLTDTLEQSIEETLSKRTRTKLFADTRSSVIEFASDLLAKQKIDILHTIECEQYRPTTVKQDFSKQIRLVEAELRKGRAIERVDEHHDQLEAAKKAKVISKTERAKRLQELEANVPDPDEYSREVGALATPLAYYSLAADRMLDSIAIHLDHDLLHPFETQLRPKLWTDLRVMDEAHCVALLAEDPQREALRARLTVERERLEAALMELHGLPQRNAF